MKQQAHKIVIPQKQITKGFALFALLAYAAVVIIGPSGLLAWSENSMLLNKRQKEITSLIAERDSLRNQVALLDPNHTDADLVGELLRRDQNLVHPDEVVIDLPGTVASKAR